MANLGDVLTYINTLLPNGLSDQTKINIINDEQRKIFKYMNETAMASFATVDGQYAYDLPSNCTVDLIQQVLVSSSTEAVTADTAFNNYEYAGQDDEMSGGNYYYEAFGKIGLYPVPEKNGYNGRILYSKRPVLFSSTDDLAVDFNIDSDWIDVIKFRTMARVAKSGNYPDVELGNNYDLEAQEMETKLKIDRAKKKAKNPKERWSYQDWI